MRILICFSRLWLTFDLKVEFVTPATFLLGLDGLHNVGNQVAEHVLEEVRLNLGLDEGLKEVISIDLWRLRWVLRDFSRSMLR